MRTYALALLLLVSLPVGASDTYRRVDEHGVTTYGENLPPGRASHRVEGGRITNIERNRRRD